MKVETLLTELAGNLPFAALEEFNTFLEESAEPQGIVHGLLLSSRKCDEILELLRAEKRTHSELATIFTTLGHVLLNIAGELSEFSHVGLHITQQLLHNHEGSIYRLITSSSSNRASKSVLRCLTGMVMCGGEAANEVLATLNWQKVNIEAVANRQSLKDVYDVRAWCIYLILAFLNSSEEPNLTKQFLLKKDLLPAIFSGLVWDPCERVINVLNVVHESVLLNPSVTKTMKIDLFTPATTKHLLDLYKWMGPIGKLAKGGNLDDLESDLAKEVLSDRNQVTDALQKFMMTLCTSTTHGIIFKEKIQGGSIKSNNWYVYKIMSNLKTPWEDPKESELMSSFLGKCPDLLKTYMPSLKSSLKPRPTKAFLSLMKMVTHIIDSQSPWTKLEAHGPEGAVGCIVPQPLIPPYIKSLLESFNSSVRFCGVKLVLSMLLKTKETSEVIQSSKELLPEVKHHAQEKIKKMVFKILKLGPIISSWEIAVGQKTSDMDEEEESPPEDLEQPLKITELLHIAKALTLYNELQPNEALHKTLDPLKMLDVVQRLPEDCTDTTENSKAKLELQVLCLELLALGKQSQESVIDSSAIEGESSQNIEESILYKLICTYAQSGKEILTQEDEHLRVVVTEKCFRILSTSLAKVGLPAHYDGSVKFWLRHITGERDTKLASFLTMVVQKTVSSLHQYTDAIIKIANNLKEQVSEGQITSFMNSLETMEIEDNREVSNVSISLPFSRLILAAVDLLEGDADPDHVEYFSKVITDYQYSVNDPELLTTYLLQNESILTLTLVEYLKSWGRESAEGGACGNGFKLQTIPLSENPSLSEILKYLFMTGDLASVEPLLEGDKLQEYVTKKDLDLAISQLLLYIHLRSDAQKGKSKVLKKYVKILQRIYLLHESSDTGEAEHVLQTVLEHPRILSAYHPFSKKVTPVTELAQDFITSVLQKHPTLISCTVPYFDTIARSIDSHLHTSDNVDYWAPVSPFVTSKNTIVSYEAAENILVTCLRTPSFPSASLETLVLELIKLISRTTSAKRRLGGESVEVLLNKFLDWGRATQEAASQETLKHLETLLVQVLSASKIEQLTSGDLKSLLQVQPACPNLCCHIVRQHPPHGRTFAKYLKKHRTALPAQALTLSLLLEQEVGEVTILAKAALVKVMDEIKEWMLDIEGPEDATSVLLPHVLKEGLLDEDIMCAVCSNLYEATVTNRQAPPKKLLSLLPVFEALSKAGPALTKLDLPEEQLSVLHICLSCIRSAYQKEDRDSDLLLGVAKVVSEVVLKVEEGSLRNSLSASKIWSSFVKQVLRVGITDPILGPDMMQTLTHLSSVVYRKDGNAKAPGEGVLPITTLYQMVMGHSQYLTLMFNQEEEWEGLKEQVIALQQTLVDCEPSVCQESHVPILLGAYGASMSTLDQRILKMLFSYEHQGFMTSYQPVLWGKTAVVHFGVKSQSLGFFKDPLPEQVVGLLNMDKILHTCFNFNTRLPLEPTEIHKADKTLYDIRFLLPLMLYLADEDRLSEIDFAECGAVVLGLIALTSHQREVWGTGAAILRCMVEKMEKSRHRRLSLPWFWMVGVVSCAMNGKYRRLPALTTHFLIHGTQLLSQPEHPLYNIVLNYVFLKPDFKLYFVPELYRLYNSAHVTDSRKHRSFLLSILSSGIRQIIDYKISQRSFTATLMMGMLQAPTVDAELKSQVLEVVEAMVRIPLGAVELVRQHSLLTVLPTLLSGDSHELPGSRSGHLLLLSSVVKVVSALWATLFDSTTRKDIVASDAPDEHFPEQDDAASPAKPTKRKRDNDTRESASKKPKVDSGIDSESSDAELSKEDPKEFSVGGMAPTEKLLPPLFIHEYLNTLMLLLPVITASSPPSTLATYLGLVSEVVQYVERVSELSNKKQRIRLAALAPETIKEQVFERVQWNILHDHLQEHLSDNQEVQLMGGRSQESMQKWRSEPLSVPLKKLDKSESESEEYCDGVRELREAVMKLLKVLGK
ncbi:nucleolar pre-ribosomal-associated protein 1-like [Eriocheir sinensis]|uniref:nucleolar pre-ribosomal-associated protein 1-like n=1 Tax=Eriocheir sinensis TaxID=95602 RepID=UPI0021C7062D|nr:nucleolar pre-ribosomal-associated protein 1-like [Eriocheir sinensis]